ncbi:hypothetical protein NON20_11905 [Synechocystis sp. B12]|nr:hypothetical protein NON20_11905 [Synechocystis sp. B12]
MIDTEDIEKTLLSLEDLYNEAEQTNEIRKLSFFSKLAIIEVCNWIEEVQDKMLMQLTQDKINEENKKYIGEIIKNNHGFGYNKNFRKLLLNIIGIIELEKVEKN